MSYARLSLALLAALTIGAASPRLAHARAHHKHRHKSGAQPRLASPFLWQVKGRAPTSWLFGTVHTGVTADELPATVTNALDQSRLFVMETDLAGIRRKDLVAAGTAPPPHDLELLLGERFLPLLSALGNPEPERARRLLPWLAAMLVMQRNASGPPPIDAILAQRASARGLSRHHLEPAGFQLATLARTTGLDDLIELLDGDDPTGVDPELLAAYRRGDLQAVLSATAPPALTPERHRILFTERNQRWAGFLRRPLDAGGAFVAVGAGHFPGEHGLLALLRTQGYVVRRVR